jgi:hypothetical protein
MYLNLKSFSDSSIILFFLSFVWMNFIFEKFFFQIIFPIYAALHDVFFRFILFD